MIKRYSELSEIRDYLTSKGYKASIDILRDGVEIKDPVLTPHGFYRWESEDYVLVKTWYEAMSFLETRS